MANASNIAVKQYINGSLYSGWTNISSAWTPIYAGKLNDGDNYVAEFKFTLASATTAINLNWYTTGDTNKGRPMYYKLLTAENSSYNNATNSNHGDGTLNTTSYGYTAQSNTITGTFAAGTYYLYIWQGATYGSDTYIHTSIFFSSATYPFTVTYTAVNTYSLTASVGTGVSLTVTISSSPYGRSGTLTPPATIYQGEVLTLTYSVSTGYAIQTHTLNGSSFNSGASTGAVSSNQSIVLSATNAIAVYNTVASSYTTGTAATIKITRYSSSYSYSIEVIQGGTTRQTLSTISWSGNTGSISWTPSNATYAPLNTSGGSVNVVLRLFTKNGGTTLGYKDANATITFDSGVDPTPSITVSDANGYYSTFGAYVQGRSAFSVSITDGLKNSATLASRSTSANGATYSASSFTTAVISQSGTLTISTTVRDSRGRTGTASLSVSVLAYTAPTATTFTVHRTDSGGTPDDAGDHFAVDWAVAITALNNQNAKKLKMEYKLTSVNTWTTGLAETTLSSYTDSGTTSPIAISTEKTYDVRLTITDSFGSVLTSTRLSTIPAVIDILDQGVGISFGKVAETANALDIGNWNAIGRVLGLGQARAQMTGADNFDSYTQMGVYGVPDGVVPSNFPPTAPNTVGGTLVVFNSLGSSRQPGEVNQTLTQEYRSKNGFVWRRTGASGLGTTVTWGAWFAAHPESSYSSSSSYCKMEDGTMIQWGVHTWSGSGTMTQINSTGIFTTPLTAISLATAFYDANYSVSASGRYATGNILPCGAIASNTSHFTCEAYDFYARSLTDGNLKIYWKAIGRWK